MSAKQYCWSTVAIVAMVTCGVSQGAAQMQDGKTRSSATTQMVAPAKAYDALLTSFEEEMMGVAQAMPAEKYSFAPTQAIFAPTQTTTYEGVRTFGKMVAHIAQANYGIFAAAGGAKATVDTKAIGSLTSKDDLVAALKASFDFAHQSVAKLTPENAFEMVPGSDGQTRGTMTGYGIAHGYDHYGQLAEYLRMNGIVPPASVKK